MNTHTLRARISVELLDETGKPVAAKGVILPVGAGDQHDVAANTERAASHVVAEIARQLDHIASGKGLIVLDIADVQARNAIGTYLRAQAADWSEFVAMLQPSRRLLEWADEIDPTPEELRRRYAALADRPIDENFRERLKAEFAKLNHGEPIITDPPAPAPEGTQ